MANINRQETAPRKVPRSKRNHAISHLSTLMPGKAHPVAFAPMQREDKLNGRVEFVVEMMETKEILANGVKARFSAYVVPWLAMPRFQGSRDQFDRAWRGKPKTDDPGETVTPFFTTHVFGAQGDRPIYKSVGLHGKATDQVNTMYSEAYNLVYNWRARNRSKKLTARLLTDTSLAPAFWHHTGFEHVVDDFDQAQMHGEAGLTIVASTAGFASVKGDNTVVQAKPADGVSRNLGFGGVSSSPVLTYAGTAISEAGAFKFGANTGLVADVGAALQQLGLTVSLANLKKAAKLQAFAEIRKHFEGHDDDSIIDMLMAGYTIEDQWLKDPILLDEEVVTFRQAKRYATTAGELDDSAVSGVATASLYLRCPQLAVGGVVVILCEILPDQLFERRRDPFLYTTAVADLPDAQVDFLDTERVDVVTNGMIDTSHSVPNDTFGYEPLNARWTSFGPGIGGDFLRPTANTAFDEARQRIWAVEAIDPVLTDDFYIAKDGIHIKPFLDQNIDPFQIQARGNLVIDGLMQFGGGLIEATGNYDKLAALSADDKIEKD